MGTVPQRCTLRAVLTIAFNDCASLNIHTPKSVRETALKRFELLEKIKQSVHGDGLTVSSSLTCAGAVSPKKEKTD